MVEVCGVYKVVLCMAQSAVEVKSFGVIQKAELKSQIIIASFHVGRPRFGNQNDVSSRTKEVFELFLFVFWIIDYM